MKCLIGEEEEKERNCPVKVEVARGTMVQAHVFQDSPASRVIVRTIFFFLNITLCLRKQAIETVFEFS